METQDEVIAILGPDHARMWEAPLTRTIDRRSVSRSGGVPGDGGLNPQWGRLQDYLEGRDPLEWARESVSRA